MRKPPFTGSGVAIVTPFTEDSINFDRLGELIEFHIGNHTDAIIICGTTGENSTMDDSEHKAAITFAVEKTAGRLPVIAGTGSNDTSYAIHLSQFAQKAGADGLLVVTPYYNKTSQMGLIHHFTVIADAVNIPIIVYNVPSRTGLNIAPETLAELAKHPNIVGIKEANGDISEVAKKAALCPEDFYIYSGNDDQIVPILSLGGVGVISVLANIMPRETHEICVKYLSGDTAGSMKLQLRLLNFINTLFIDVNPIPVKEALNLAGFNVGNLRLPLCGLCEKNLEALKDAMREVGFKV